MATGLSDNYVKSLVIDKNGFLWMGMSEGLNVFDNSVKPELIGDVNIKGWSEPVPGYKLA